MPVDPARRHGHRHDSVRPLRSASSDSSAVPAWDTRFFPSVVTLIDWVARVWCTFKEPSWFLEMCCSATHILPEQGGFSAEADMAGSGAGRIFQVNGHSHQVHEEAGIAEVGEQGFAGTSQSHARQGRSHSVVVVIHVEAGVILASLVEELGCRLPMGPSKWRGADQRSQPGPSGSTSLCRLTRRRWSASQPPPWTMSASRAWHSVGGKGSRRRPSTVTTPMSKSALAPITSRAPTCRWLRSALAMAPPVEPARKSPRAEREHGAPSALGLRVTGNRAFYRDSDVNLKNGVRVMELETPIDAHWATAPEEPETTAGSQFQKLTAIAAPQLWRLRTPS